MSIAQLRPVVAARRNVGDKITEALMPSERDARAAAISAARLLTAALEVQAEARLGNVGIDVIEILSDQVTSATRSLARVSEAHVRMREIGHDHRIPFASFPDCPPNESGSNFLGLPGLGG